MFSTLGQNPMFGAKWTMLSTRLASEPMLIASALLQPNWRTKQAPPCCLKMLGSLIYCVLESTPMFSVFHSYWWVWCPCWLVCYPWALSEKNSENLAFKEFILFSTTFHSTAALKRPSQDQYFSQYLHFSALHISSKNHYLLPFLSTLRGLYGLSPYIWFCFEIIATRFAGNRIT